MLRIYYLDFFLPYCVITKISVSLYQKGRQFSCHKITGRHVKDLSPQNVYLVLFLYERHIYLHFWGTQLSRLNETGLLRKIIFMIYD